MTNAVIAPTKPTGIRMSFMRVDLLSWIKADRGFGPDIYYRL